MNLTIAIPSKGVNSSLNRVLDLAIKSEANEILVGINPDGKNLDPLINIDDTRVRYYFHKTDLGLYGNFRFLASKAKGYYFHWLCTDDQVSTSAVSQIVQLKKSSSAPNLIISRWNWCEYNPNLNPNYDLKSQISGVYPSVETKKETVESALNCEPSWIFGFWKTSYLNEIFPKKNFDWLDTFLLQKVITTRKVTILENDTPTLIGTWHWANKVPHSVKPTGHNPYLAIYSQIMCIPKLMSLDPKCLPRILLRIKFLISSSKNMNRLINERK